MLFPFRSEAEESAFAWSGYGSAVPLTSEVCSFGAYLLLYGTATGDLVCPRQLNGTSTATRG
jgi:hypothetical protein